MLRSNLRKFFFFACLIFMIITITHVTHYDTVKNRVKKRLFLEEKMYTFGKEADKTGELTSKYSDLTLICDNFANESASKLLVNWSSLERHRFNAKTLDYISSATCEKYFAEHLHFNERESVNDLEREFPIAFGILVYHNFDQVEQLLRLIYRKNNFYCFHVDEGADKEFKYMV